MLQVVNTLFLIGGIICSSYGLSIIPTSLQNNGEVYIGNPTKYSEDLKHSQLGSYGFKLVVIGLSITGGNILSLVLSCCYIRYEDTSTVQPEAIRVLQ